MPKKATRCFGLIKPLISPISAIKVIAVKRPIPGIESINSIFYLTDSGNSDDSIKELISFNRLFISDSRVLINAKELDILTDKPPSGTPIIAASCEMLINLEYIFSDQYSPFLDFSIRILITSSLGESIIDFGVG